VGMVHVGSGAVLRARCARSEWAAA
jgi:hypothetical protein